MEGEKSKKFRRDKKRQQQVVSFKVKDRLLHRVERRREKEDQQRQRIRSWEKNMGCCPTKSRVEATTSATRESAIGELLERVTHISAGLANQ